jgi:hypothetical protein
MDNATVIHSTELSIESEQTEADVILTHVIRINASWQKVVGSIIETGQLLIETKKALRGKFGKVFETGKLLLSQDTAQELMRIAKNPVLSNPAHGPYLPPHWRTLAVLTHAPVKKLEAWLADGTINAETERSKAEELIDKKPAKAKAVKKVSDNSDATDSDATASTTANATATADATNEQHCLEYLRGLHRLLTDATAVDWERLLEDETRVGMVRDIIEELKTRIVDHEETVARVARDREFEAAKKLN